jgi:hypothetical protein
VGTLSSSHPVTAWCAVVGGAVGSRLGWAVGTPSSLQPAIASSAFAAGGAVGKADGNTKDAQVGTLVGARVVGAGVGTMNGVRAGFHVGDAVSTATGGNGAMTEVGANDTNCRLEGGIDGPN